MTVRTAMRSAARAGAYGVVIDHVRPRPCSASWGPSLRLLGTVGAMGGSGGKTDPYYSPPHGG